MKLAIVGSRSFKDYTLLKNTLEKYTDVSLIITGDAIGADSLAQRYAKEKNIPAEVHVPEWHKKGIFRGLLRNTLIVEACDQMVAFWDGQSTGTKDSIDKAQKLKKEVEIVKCELQSREIPEDVVIEHDEDNRRFEIYGKGTIEFRQDLRKMGGKWYPSLKRWYVPDEKNDEEKVRRVLKRSKK